MTPNCSGSDFSAYKYEPYVIPSDHSVIDVILNSKKVIECIGYLQDLLQPHWVLFLPVEAQLCLYKAFVNYYTTTYQYETNHLCDNYLSYHSTATMQPFWFHLDCNYRDVLLHKLLNW